MSKGKGSTEDVGEEAKEEGGGEETQLVLYCHALFVFMIVFIFPGGPMSYHR